MSKKYDSVIRGFNHMLHGGDYNPDQWLDMPDILDEDMRLLKKAHCNTLSVGIFSWALLEPEEGKYDFGWLDDIMDRLHKNGAVAVLATPSAARPRWMAEKYPEVLRVAENGHRNQFGGRHNHCYSSPVYREKILNINTLLAKRYKDHPALGLWHVSNELSGDCHCELCQENFRSWLKVKYNNDLELLNKQWWTDFWSHRVTDWNHIHSPAGGTAINAHSLDWKRFVTDMTIDFFLHEIKPLREITPQIKVTANYMAHFSPLNYQKLSKHIDVVSWDSYPRFKGDSADPDVFMTTAFNHDCMRGFKDGKPFLLMESTPSMTNWMTVATLKRPNQHLLSSIQAIAHGSDSVQYFQWRKGRGGAEKFHGAVIDHVGHENTRVFRDVTDVGEVLEKLDGVVGCSVRAEVAIVFDWENWWALNGMQALRNDKKDYLETALMHYKAFWEKSVPVDIISADSDFSKYKLVCAPVLYMTDADVIDKIESYVKSGGVFVGTYWSGVVNKNDLCWTGGFPAGRLKDVFGIWAEEIDTLSDGRKVIVNVEGERFLEKEKYEAELYCELSHLLPGSATRVLAAYGSEFYGGMPALTVNEYGSGRCYYMAFYGGYDFVSDFYSGLLKEMGIANPLDISLPKHISLRSRAAEFPEGDPCKNDEHFFILNTSPDATDIDLPDGLINVITGAEIKIKTGLEPFGTLIAKRK